MEKWVERLRLWGWVTSTASLAVGAGLWLVFRNQMPPQIPLWYSQPWGDAQLAGPTWILILPGMAVAVGIVGGMIVRRISRYVPLAMMMAATSIVIQGILVLGMLRIVLVIV